MWLSAFLALAAAADFEEVSTSTNGPLVPGVATAVELVLLEDGEVYPGFIEKADATGGHLINLQRLESGVWKARVRAKPGVEAMELRLVAEDGRDAELSFPIRDAPESSVRTRGDFNVVAGQRNGVEFTVHGEGNIGPEDLSIWVSEGSASATADAGHVAVEWVPGEARQPHMGLVGIRDLRTPDAMPLWVPVQMRARPPVTVRTEAGTSLSIQLGSRRYGPVVAGDDGSVTARVDVYPGEQTAIAFLSDSLGNTQETTITVAPEPEPILGILVDGELAAGRRSPRVFLKALDGSGRPWTGEPPECRVAGGDPLQVSELQPSEWLAVLSESATGASFDLRIDCQLGGLQQAAVIPVRRAEPHKVVLQVYPRILSADFPVAQVQAFLEDAAGDRIGADGIELNALAGSLEDVLLDGGALKANYRGQVTQSGDTLTASYNRDAGEGPVWQLNPSWRLSGDFLQVAVRVLDSGSRPVAEQTVSVRLNGEEFSAVSDARGWVEGRFRAPEGPAVLTAVSNQIEHSRLVVGDLAQWRDPAIPDLYTEEGLEFQAGRVSQVFITADAGFVYGEPGAQTTIQVRLLDRGGRTVTGEPFELRASQGLVEPARELADGTYVAVYRPPAGLSYGEVLLSVEGGDGRFGASTSLEIVPRPQRVAIGIAGGGLRGVNGIAGASLSLDVETKLDALDGLFQARLGLFHWQDRAVVSDASRDSEIELQLANYGLGAHLIARREWQDRSSWVGIGGVLVPFTLRTRFEGEDSIIGWGLHRPGVILTGGAARRALSGEVFGELRFIGVNGRTGDVGYDGSVGGMAAVAGYRVIL